MGPSGFAREQVMMRLPLPMAYADPAFQACLSESIGTAELVSNFDRLYGADLSGRRSPISRMVDHACGKDEDDMRGFVEFVHTSIYMTLPDEALAALRAGKQASQEPKP